MFKVIVVDDEPSALNHICSIIEKKNTDFEVIATAENGQEGIEKTRSLQPDLVITDVKMPLMDGITFISTIKKELPDIFTIIISGYQDFEYAKGAIQSGACDYILKPVLPSSMQKVLEEIAEKLNINYYHERKNIIHQLVNGKNCSSDRIKKYFPYKSYYLAIIRKNGLLRRFATNSNIEIYSNIHEIMTIYGRDEMEALYIIPKELLFGKTFAEYIIGVKDAGKSENQYSTLIYSKNDFPVTQLPEKIKELYRTLDTVSVVGLNQEINMEESSLKKEIEFNHTSINMMLENLDHLVREQQYDKLKKELKRLYLIWNEEKKPQLWMEHITHQIIYILNKYNKEYLPLIEYEYMIEDAFFYSISYDELMDNLFDIIFKYMKKNNDFSGKVDSREFFIRIEIYLEKHIDENITLQSVCKTFAVSQTHLSRLFRKYGQQSFNRYLTNIRMEKASQLMQQYPEIYIKDVARMVGYSDQFYFSRVFHSYKGKCPSDYLAEK